jgi:hypothetical protein
VHRECRREVTRPVRVREEDIAGLLGGHYLAQRRDESVERVGRQRRRLDAQDLRDIGRRQLDGDGRRVRADDGHLDRLAALLRSRDGLPARFVERAVLLFRDDEHHEITRASSLSAATSALAASAGLPPIICVCFRFSGT